MSIVFPDEELKILLIDPDPVQARISGAHLEKTAKLSVHSVSTGKDALTLSAGTSFDAIVSDYDMPDMNGMNLHRALQERGVKIPFLLFTAPPGVRRKDGCHDGAGKELSDPPSPPEQVYSDLSQKIIQAIELYRTRNRLELYSRHLEELVEERTRQLQDIQRLAVIGELSTMIGHDMRNPLQVITNLIFILTRKMEQMSPEEAEVLRLYDIPGIFSRISAETQYLNKIVSDLQNYAQEVDLTSEPIDPGMFLDLLLSSILIPDSVTVIRDYQPGIVVNVDQTLFRRIMENLIINAIQAMDGDGSLTLATREEHEHITLTISDTGKGIPPDAQDRIFEPLFTTKSKGTGLGLAVCKRLVEAHGGTLSLKSTSQEGTCFEVTLPAGGQRTNMDG